MTKYLTVVYAIEDEQAFKPVSDDIFKQMGSFDVNNRPPFGVCAASTSNEIHRLALLEDALNNNDPEEAQNIAQAILSLFDVPDIAPKEYLE